MVFRVYVSRDVLSDYEEGHELTRGYVDVARCVAKCFVIVFLPVINDIGYKATGANNHIVGNVSNFVQFALLLNFIVAVAS